MKTCKSKTIDLLNEIKSVCDANEIKYFVSGDLALFEVDRMEVADEFANGSVAVFARDVKKLTALLEKKENRKVESLENNSKFPGFYMRYMDTSTTLVNFKETAYTYDTNSFGINIEFICGRRRNTFKRKVLYKLKQMWVKENAPHYMRKRNEKRSLKDKMVSAFFKAAKHTPVMKWLYSEWIREGSAKTKKRDLATTRGTIARFDAVLFAGTRKMMRLGEEFRGFTVARRTKLYTDAYFVNNKIRRSFAYDVCSLDVPWEQFSATIKKNHINLKQYQEDEQQYLNWKKDVYQPVYNKRQRYYSFMFLAEDRMQFYKEFKGPKKAKVKRQYRNERYVRLNNTLAEYIDKVNYYANHRIGFCFDHEIFRITLSLMLRQAYNRSKSIEEFDRKSRRIVNIVRRTNFRHFDNVENVFFGERRKPRFLKRRKERILNSVIEEAANYREMFEEKKRR